jgi:hypothetical protein
MCRNIKTLTNFEPEATDDEVRASALQFVRKISGTTKPSKANEELFNQAVADVTHIARHLIDAFVTHAPARNRDEEVQKARERSLKRFPRERAQAS